MYATAIITAVGHYVPEQIVTNYDLEKLMNTSDQWITERTGIKERRFVKDGEPTSELALRAVGHLKEQYGNQALDGIDLILAATLSPDFYFPGIGTIIQNKLGLDKIPALDIRAQCSGLVYGIDVASAMIASQRYNKILFICAEVQSPALELNNHGRDMAVLFGDGAGVLLIEALSTANKPTVANGMRGVIDSVLGSDGSGAELLCLRSPGTATAGFMNESVYSEGSWHPAMEGATVFKNAVTRMPEVALKIMHRNQIEPQQIDLLLPHQANLRINEAVRERLGIAPEKVFNNIQKYGNTTAATIPILMSEAVLSGRLKQGDLLLTLAFGAGFTWGANLIRW